MSPLGIFSISCFSIIAFIILVSAFFSEIPRKIGFRNIRRRLGNTMMVILGSMVGSALISGSLVLSDSLDKTFHQIAEVQMGEVDAALRITPNKLFNTPTPYLTADEVSDIESRLDKERVDGLMPVINTFVAPQKLDENGKAVLNVYGAEFNAIDFEELNSFGQEPYSLEDLENNEAYISEAIAKKLEAQEGSMIRLPFGEKNLDYKVKRILGEKEFYGDFFVVVDEESTKSIGYPEGAGNVLLISAKGEFIPADYDGKEFEKYLDESLKDFDTTNVSISVQEQKENGLNGFGFGAISDVFLIMSFFGIFAGILLIVNLYSMLAAERKYEMGIMRAIAFTRMQLTKTFVYEGLLYTLASSFVGTIVGMGVGYFLVYSLNNAFGSIFDLIGRENFLHIVFGVEIDSLVIAFAAGGLITVITAIIASYKISKLNIVEAIRDTKEEKRFKINWKWILTTLILGGVTLLSFMSFLGFFVIRGIYENGRAQEGNALNQMTEAQYEESLMVSQAYMLYFGFVLTLIFGTALFDRLVKAFFKKDISKLTVTLSSAVVIIFTSMITRFDSIVEAGQYQSSIALYFLSGIFLVVSLALIVTHNLELISSIISTLLRPFRGLSSIVKISLRYPAENKLRTGLTLVMFAVVIYLIVYTSLMKVTIKTLNENNTRETLGGYQLLIIPSPDNTSNQVETIKGDIKEVPDVENVANFIHTQIILPEYKYEDLKEEPYYGDPAFNMYEETDYFKTNFDALPADFLRDRNIKLSQRADGFESDAEVWEAVASDPSKIVIGFAFTDPGYGKRPALKVGDRVKIANAINGDVEEKEIIGAQASTGNTGFNVSFYNRIITSTDSLNAQFEKEYIEKFSTQEILVKAQEDAPIGEVSINVRKAVISHNIAQMFELEELTKTTQGLLDSFILMFQAFMGFSLVVGVSGLAIIVARAVHERRQQIGMLRSLGFQRSMILAGFFIETTFITLLGIVIGISMGTIGALNDFNITFKDQPELRPSFAYTEVFIISLMVYLASLLFALMPSIRAAKLSPVEATNYPE